MARAPKIMREPAGGSSRTMDDIDAEFAELDRQSDPGRSRGSPDHLRLAAEPRRLAVGPGRGQYPPPPLELERLVRGARRAAIFAAVMSTMALFMSVGALLAGLAQLAV